MDLLRQAPPSIRPLSPVDLDGNDLGSVKVQRESDNIDLLITADDPKIAVAVENKIGASEHSNQLRRYKKTVESKYPNHNPLFIFLTPEGDEPSQAEWIPYTYGDIHRVLNRALRLNEDSIGDDVSAFLRHYLSLIKGHLMEDPEINDLCNRIYKNHRQAIELLFERVGDPRSFVVRTIRDALLDDNEKWYVEGDQSVACRFLPRSWLGFLPPINSRPQQHPSSWVFASIRARYKGVYFNVTVGPTSDSETRSKLIEAIHAESGKKNGFKLNRKESGENWAKVFSQSLVTDRNGLDYSETVAEFVIQQLPEIETRLNQMGRFIESVMTST